MRRARLATAAKSTSSPAATRSLQLVSGGEARSAQVPSRSVPPQPRPGQKRARKHQQQQQEQQLQLQQQVDGDAVQDIEDVIRFRDEDDQVMRVRTALLSWYSDSRRRLPWRGDGPPGATTCVDPSPVHAVTPYQTWVSEIMCQQTRVETVIGYYNNWMKHFGTVEKLAAASSEEVNAQWAGLGYYSRARNLHKGAKHVVEHLGGQLPKTPKELEKIPGIGPYTAGAIASIAFDQRVPVVDGNVVRVLARMRRIDRDNKDKALIRACWLSAADLVQAGGRPGDLNQSLMELGATCCTPRAPACERCPVQAHCRAFQSDPSTVTSYPRAAERKQSPEHNVVVMVCARPRPKCVVCSGRSSCQSNSKSNKEGSNWTGTSGIIQGAVDRKAQDPGDREFLMWRRPKQGLLAGQWEFTCAVTPHVVKEPTSRAGAKKRKSMPIATPKPATARRAVLDAIKQRSSTVRSFEEEQEQQQHQEDDPASTNIMTCGACRRVERGEVDALTSCVLIGTHTHVFSHVRHRMSVFLSQVECECICQCTKCLGGSQTIQSQIDRRTVDVPLRWMSAGDMDRVGVTKAVSIVMAMVDKFERSPRLSFAPLTTVQGNNGNDEIAKKVRV